eukprot:scaffold223535_cov55-Prasinocladus_malaysianus.AAC.1
MEIKWQENTYILGATTGPEHLWPARSGPITDPPTEAHLDGTITSLGDPSTRSELSGLPPPTSGVHARNDQDDVRRLVPPGEVVVGQNPLGNGVTKKSHLPTFLDIPY